MDIKQFIKELNEKMPKGYRAVYSGRKGAAPFIIRKGKYIGNLHPNDIIELTDDKKEEYIQKIIKSIKNEVKA